MSPSAADVTDSTARHRSSLLVAVCLCISAGGASSCENGAPAVPRDDLDLRVCTENWRTIYSPEQEPISFVPQFLGHQGGRLYTVVSTGLETSLISLPDSGGEPQTLVKGRVSNPALSLEGDNVLFMSAGDPVTLPNGSRAAPTVLESIPGGGGASQVITTVRQASDVPVYTQAWAADAEQVYWVNGGPGQTPALWATARTGAGSRILADLVDDSDFTVLAAIQVAGDQVVVYQDGFGFDVPVYSIPKTGGVARRLPTAWNGATLLGVTSDGTVLVQRQTKIGNGEPASERFELGRLLPGAEAVETFSLGQPETMYALKAWDDGAAGLYVLAWEWRSNGARHATMWSVDAEGRGRRVACDPLVGSMLSAAAVAPDGIYGIQQYSNTTAYWSVVKIAR